MQAKRFLRQKSRAHATFMSTVDAKRDYVAWKEDDKVDFVMVYKPYKKTDSEGGVDAGG